MSNSNVRFTLNGIDTTIQCSKNDKMRDICQKYATKIDKNINLFIFLYGGNQVNFDLTFQDQANSIDKANNQMKVLVYDKEIDEFICPKCGEKINFNNEKIDELIISNNSIKENINGIKVQLENIVRNSSTNLVNIQLNNIIIILNKINEDIKKNDEKLKNLLNNNDQRIARKIPPISSCTKIEQIGNLDIYLYPKINFNENEEQNALKILVFGETGSGKTTFINSFANVLLGVDIIDDFRYKIIQKNSNDLQTNSQIKGINIYNIKSIENYSPIKIIDTPGFNDVDGIVKDNIKFEQIEKYIKENLNDINAICLIMKSTNNKLTFYQKYIYGKFLDMFGEDLKRHFIFILTFSDGGLPGIIPMLKNEKSFFKELIESIENETWFFKFNNSSFFESNREDEATKLFWKLGIKNFEDFIIKVKALPKKSLYLTKEVINERKILEEKIKVLNIKLKEGLKKCEELKNLIKAILNSKKNSEAYKNYEIRTKVRKIRKVETKPNTHSIICLYCNKTCHARCNCNITNDSEVINVLQWIKMATAKYVSENAPGIFIKLYLIL